ncbi:ribosome hibernation-promoting factor, HPF/YfiA family [Caldisalinibacter kiritimatiensis]|uniref:Ribosome hibernation promoting factor n=1 Tax=Caldisalinibacter kiritimatiensis TaxID=1304284 RepID=R1AS95_9FIRM|nr:ribosome-associated translation inhibitor RaiA [Caldisalinibacter kiritimatiensis]EOC99992.1 Ribosomal subunit interface protein [Caldisalinibacter kiritimatiensis]
MKIIVTGKNINVTDALRDMIDKKLSKLDKYFSKEVEAKVILIVEKTRQIIEITIPFDGAILRAEEKSNDMYHSIDEAIEVLERQIRKHKTKLQRRNHLGETIRFENIAPLENGEKEDEHKIVKTKRFAIKPMDAEEAVLQMELLGHNFFVFRDADTDEVNVVYKRKDGNYGLIEPEF